MSYLKNNFNEISNQENKYNTHNYKSELKKQLYYCSGHKFRDDIKSYFSFSPEDASLFDWILADSKYNERHYKGFKIYAILMNLIIMFMTAFMCIYNNYLGIVKSTLDKLDAGVVLFIFMLGVYFLDKKMYIKDPDNPNIYLKVTKAFKLLLQLPFSGMLLYYVFLAAYSILVNKSNNILDEVTFIAWGIVVFWLVCTFMWGLELHQLKKIKSLIPSTKKSNYVSVIIFVMNCIFSIFTLILSVSGKKPLTILQISIGIISSILFLISIRVVIVNRSVIMDKENKNIDSSRSPNSLVTFIILILSFMFLLLQNILAK